MQQNQTTKVCRKCGCEMVRSPDEDVLVDGGRINSRQYRCPDCGHGLQSIEVGPKARLQAKVMRQG